MNRLFVFFLCLLSATIGRADLLGGTITLSPPPGWKNVPPFPSHLSPSPHATLKYVPVDGRRASIVITLLPSDILGFAVKNHRTLRRFNRIAAAPFLSGMISPPQPLDLELPGGLAIYLTTSYPRPAIPATPEPCRMVTTASLLVGRDHLVHVAIFHDGNDTSEHRQALQAVQSMRDRGNQLAGTNQEPIMVRRAALER